MKILYNDKQYCVNQSLFEEDNVFAEYTGKWDDFVNSDLGKELQTFNVDSTDSSTLDSSVLNSAPNLVVNIKTETIDIVTMQNDAIKSFNANFNKHMNESNSIFEKNDMSSFINWLNKTDIKQNNKSKIDNKDSSALNKPNEESDKTEQLIQEDIPVDDPVYKTVLQLLYKDGSASDTLKDAMLQIAKAHNAILDFYTTSLYEDDWSDSDIFKFDKLIQIYNENLAIVKKELQTTEWNYNSNEERFFEKYHEIVKDDNYTFNRLRARHQNYMRYRSNRMALIWQLGKMLGIPKLSGKKDGEKLFNVLNEQCDQIKLYDNTNEKGESTVNSKYCLKSSIEKIKSDLVDKANIGENRSSQYDYEDFSTILDFYVQCRKDIYKMFNTCTSKRKYNGWTKWQNVFKSFCDAELKDYTMRQLYNATKSGIDYNEDDDHWQEIDQRIFNAKGIYENKQLNETWWDEDVKWYKEHRSDKYTKDKIKSIKMIPTNANICKVYLDNGYVYAQVDFYPNDIIEICPTRKIEKSSLYTQDIRNLVFEVDKNNEWVMPFGYCQFYEPENYKKEANCHFYWDPTNRVIVIKAINNISKGDKLVLKVFQK